jgi:hypothetical protein
MNIDIQNTENTLLSTLFPFALKWVSNKICAKDQMDLSMKTKVIVGKLLGVQYNNSDNGNRPIYQISTAI